MFDYSSRRFRWWSLVPALALLLFSPSVVFAEEVIVDDSSSVDSGVDVAISEQPVSGDEALSEVTVDNDAASAPVPEEPVQLYSEDGTLLVTSSAPADVESFSIGSSWTASPYQSVTSDTYRNLAGRYVHGWASVTDDYLFYQCGQYEFALVLGELEGTGSSFTGTGCTVFRFYRSSSSDGYRVESGVADVSVNTSDFIVYSNRAGFPALDTYNRPLVLSLLAVSGSALCIHAVWGWFRYVIRERR